MLHPSFNDNIDSNNSNFLFKVGELLQMIQLYIIILFNNMIMLLKQPFYKKVEDENIIDKYNKFIIERKSCERCLNSFNCKCESEYIKKIIDISKYKIEDDIVRANQVEILNLVNSCKYCNTLLGHCGCFDKNRGKEYEAIIKARDKNYSNSI
jgi:hypothetical protein